MHCVLRLTTWLFRAPVIEAPLSDCYGTILRKDIVARVDVPSADNSAMDGYAFCHADLQEFVGASDAQIIVGGRNHWQVILLPEKIPRGQAIRIATGASIPDGADCIIIQENITANADENAF